MFPLNEIDKYHLRSEGGIVFSSDCLCVCVFVCLSVNMITHSWTYGRKGGQVKNGYIGLWVRGWWWPNAYDVTSVRVADSEDRPNYVCN